MVGGGLAGAALAKALADKGVRVLVLEQETVFKDRVRGEYLHCWGVAETRMLGIYDLLKESCAKESRYFSSQMVGAPPTPPRDLVETTPHQVGSFSFHHPETQTVLLTAAEEAGAEARRGVTVLGVSPGQPASVHVQEADGECAYSARLVVGADGRNSRCRGWGGFNTRCDPDCLVVAGVLYEGMSTPDNTVHLTNNVQQSNGTLVVPLGKDRFRSYVVHLKEDPLHLSGPKAAPDFVNASVASGVPAEWYEGAQVVGPLASFDGADTWVEHPYRDGVVLIGDAAASSDPSFGSGLSLTLRDVRVLRDELLANGDWDVAGHRYAAEHDRYYGAFHTHLDWLRQLLYERGAEADARRMRAFPLIAQDPMRMPDITGLGPEFPCDETARRRLFGEE